VQFSLSALQEKVLSSALGLWVGRTLVRAAKGPLLSSRAAALIEFDLLRLKARIGYPAGDFDSPHRMLHLGCGTRQIEGWLNVDVSGSDFDVDLARMPLPFANGAFDVVVSQQVIEHLDYSAELIPLLAELARVVAPGGEVWMSCPDMDKICAAYVRDKGVGLVANKRERGAYDPTLGRMPPQVSINWAFHQGGQHKNLFDFELLAWAATEVGMGPIVPVDEGELLRRFPTFPRRNDGYQSVYVRVAVS